MGLGVAAAAAQYCKPQRTGPCHLVSLHSAIDRLGRGTHLAHGSHGACHGHHLLTPPPALGDGIQPTTTTAKNLTPGLSLHQPGMYSLSCDTAAWLLSKETRGLPPEREESDGVAMEDETRQCDGEGGQGAKQARGPDSSSSSEVRSSARRWKALA